MASATNCTTCMPGFTGNGTTKCSAPKCLIEIDGVCQKCEGPYELNNSNLCIAKNCKTLTANSPDCTTCNDNYTKSGTNTCEPSNCTTKSSDERKCKVCNAEYYLHNDMCKAKVANCMTHDYNKGICVTC